MIQMFLPERPREQAATVQQLGHPAAGVIGWIDNSKNTSGVFVNEDLALNFSAVWAATRIISETVATLPAIMYQRRDDGGKQRAQDHPLWRILHDEPNSEMSSYTFFETETAHLVNWGNSYAEIERLNNGTVVGVHPRTPDTVRVERDRDSGDIFYRVNGDTVPAESMLHIPGIGFDGLMGYSVIQRAQQSIGLGMAAERYGGSFFGNGAMPSGVLRHPSHLKKEAREHLRREWNEVHQGPDKSNKVAVLWEGMDYTQIGMPNDAAQFLESRKFQITDIARWYRIPPHMLADLEKATYCMPASTMVFTEHGPKSIADVKPGEAVWSFGSNGAEKARVKNSVCSGTDRILAIRTTNRTVRCNARHRILVRRKTHVPSNYGVCLNGRKYRTEWVNRYVPAGELQVGDTLVTLGNLPNSGKRCTPTRSEVSVGFMEFCGLLLGDGNINSQKGRPSSVSIARANTAPYMDHYRRVMLQEFTRGGRTWMLSGSEHPQAKLSEAEVECIRVSTAATTDVAQLYSVSASTIRNIRSGKSWGDARTTQVAPIVLQEAERTTRFSSASAAEELTALGLSGTAKTKSVPSWVFGLAEDLQLGFLRGFLDADGTVDKKGRIAFHSCNEHLLSQMRHLCMATGVPVTNLRCQEGVTRLPNGKQQSFRMYSFTCSDPGHNARIWSHDPRYQERLAQGKPFGRKDRGYPKHGGRDFSLNNASLARISSIEVEPAEPVYDLEVEGTHSFVADGVVVHNSNIEQQSLDFVIYSLTPWLTRWEKGLKRKLMSERDKQRFFIEFLVEGLLRGDTKSRYEAYATARQWGWLSVNDIRVLENMNPVNEGDVYLQPMNMQPAGSDVDMVQHFAEVREKLDAITGSQAHALEGEMRDNLRRSLSQVVRSGKRLKDSISEAMNAGVASFEQALATSVAQVEQEHKSLVSGIRDERELIVKDMDEAGKRVVVAIGQSVEQITRRERQAMLQAATSMLEDAVDRMVRNEARAISRAAKREKNFVAWMDEFYAKHQETVADAFQKPAEACAVLTGHTSRDMARKLVTEHVEASRSQLLEACDGDPETFVERVEQLVTEWPQTRTSVEIGA